MDEEEYGNMLKKELDLLENKIMHIEMSLQQVLNNGIATFDEKLGANVKACKESGNVFFEEANGYVEQYCMDLKTFAIDAHEKLVATFGNEPSGAEDNEDEVSQDSQQQKLEELLAEKDVLMGKLEQSCDFLAKEVNDVDKTIMGRIDKEYKDKIKQIRSEQHDRNRRIVMEIIQTKNKFSAEIEE